MKSPEAPYHHNQHLSREQLLRYQAGELYAAEMHQVERHLLDCEFCSDALEGIALLEPQQALASLEEVKSRLSGRLQEEKFSPASTYWKWAVAAAVALLIFAAMFLMIELDPDTEQRVAQQEILEQEKVKPTVEKDEKPQASAPMAAEGRRVNAPKADNIVEITEEKAPAVLAQKPESKAIEPVVVQEPSPAPVIAQVESLEVPENAAAANKDVSHALRGRAAGVSVTSSRKQEVKSSKLTGDTRLVAGKVVEANSGEPLPGVSILITGTSTGTMSKIDGTYALPVPPKAASLEFSFIGYQTKKIELQDTTTQLLADLEPDMISMQEVVVIGYGVQKSVQVTGAISSVSAAPEQEPQPIGGQRKFKRYLLNNLRYPEAAARAGIEGTVVVEFFVEADGTISQPEVTEGLGYGLDEEALRLIQQGPKWQPAQTNGAPVRYKTRVSIPFSIEK